MRHLKQLRAKMVPAEALVFFGSGRYETLMRWRSPSSSGFIEPCLPTLAHTVPSGPQWVHEIKHDGFRFICRREGDRVRVFFRRAIEAGER